MNIQSAIMRHLDRTRLMQLATCLDNKPWCATVYFALDNAHNLYWISQPTRRHSKELVVNPAVAGTIVAPHVDGQKPAAVQFEGEAYEISVDDRTAHRGIC